jgi:hypothetical protein
MKENQDIMILLKQRDWLKDSLKCLYKNGSTRFARKQVTQADGLHLEKDEGLLNVLKKI